MLKNFYKALSTIEKKAKTFEVDEKIDELKELLADKGFIPAKKEEKKTSPLVVILAVVGAIAAVAAIAYAVFWFMLPEDSEYFEDFDDFEDFDEDDYEDEPEDIDIDD